MLQTESISGPAGSAVTRTRRAKLKRPLAIAVPREFRAFEIVDQQAVPRAITVQPVSNARVEALIGSAENSNGRDARATSLHILQNVRQKVPKL